MARQTGHCVLSVPVSCAGRHCRCSTLDRVHRIFERYRLGGGSPAGPRRLLPHHRRGQGRFRCCRQCGTRVRVGSYRKFKPAGDRFRGLEQCGRTQLDAPGYQRRLSRLSIPCLGGRFWARRIRSPDRRSCASIKRWTGLDRECDGGPSLGLGGARGLPHHFAIFVR